MPRRLEPHVERSLIVARIMKKRAAHQATADDLARLKSITTAALRKEVRASRRGTRERTV